MTKDLLNLIGKSPSFKQNGKSFTLKKIFFVKTGPLTV